MGAQIARDYQDKQPALVAVLRGAAVFCADLIRQMDLNLTLDFIAVSSYGAATEASGQVRLIKDVERSVEGTDLILVEDIVDSGLTLKYLLGNLESRSPASLRVCTLLSKPSRRKMEVPLDYVGFEIPDEFVIGYGMDFNEKYRNLPFIGVLRDTVSGQ